MNIYADRGNILFLRHRCEWRGISFLLRRRPGEQLDPGAHDLIYIGGGQTATSAWSRSTSWTQTPDRPRRSTTAPCRQLSAAATSCSATATNWARRIAGLGLLTWRRCASR